MHSATQLALLVNIINSSDDAIVSKDTDSIITSWNPAAERIFGYTAEEAIGRHIYLIIPNDFIHEEVALMKKIFAGESIDHFQTQRQKKNGEVVFVTLSISPIRDANGTIIGASKVARDITELKKAKEQVAKGELRYKNLLENINDVILVFDHDFNYSYASPNLERITGWTIEETRTHERGELIHPDDRKHFLSLFEAIKTNPGSSIPFEFRLKHKEGHYIWIEGSAQNLLLDPSIQGIVFAYRDISERKATEEKVKKLHAEISASEQQLRLMIEHAPASIAMFDNQMHYIAVSKRWMADYKLENKSIIGRSHYEVFPEIPDAWKKLHQRALAGESLHSDEDPFPRSDGSTDWVKWELQPWRKDSSEIGGVVLFSEVITARKLVEQELRNTYAELHRSEIAYKTIASSIPGSVISLLDREYRYLLIEGDLVEKLGFSKEDLLHKTIEEAVGTERFQQLLPRLTRVCNGETFIAEDKRKDFYTIDRYVPLKDKHNVVYAFMIVVIDITDLKLAEEKIQQLNVDLENKVIRRTQQLETANKDLESFSYSVSHDLRAPLRAISGYSTMLEEDYGKMIDENGKRILKIIRDSTAQMGQLIDDLLSFSRLGRKETHMSIIKTDQLIQTCIDELKPFYPDTEFRILNLTDLRGDVALIKQVFVNYLTNAAKFSAMRASPLVEIDSVTTDTECIYTISDNGVGFDMKYIDKLFNVFQRLHRNEEFEGTGVGLAIVKRIITNHGGRVWAESELDSRSAFHFSLPLVAKEN